LAVQELMPAPHRRPGCDHDGRPRRPAGTRGMRRGLGDVDL